MTRYLITYINAFNKLQAEYFDHPDENGLEPSVESVVACYDKARIRWAYKHYDCPPKYAYHRTDRAGAHADLLVYRETPDGDFLFTGAVHCELIHPAIADVQAVAFGSGSASDE